MMVPHVLLLTLVKITITSLQKPIVKLPLVKQTHGVRVTMLPKVCATLIQVRLVVTRREGVLTSWLKGHHRSLKPSGMEWRGVLKVFVKEPCINQKIRTKTVTDLFKYVFKILTLIVFLVDQPLMPRVIKLLIVVHPPLWVMVLHTHRLELLQELRTHLVQFQRNWTPPSVQNFQNL